MQRKIKNNSVLFATISLLSTVFYINSANLVHAQDTVDVPIVFESSDPITAADFSVEVNGGTLISLKCGGDHFQSIDTSMQNKCIVFNPSGATSGTLGTATVRSTNGGKATVTPSGTFSTAEGVEPSHSTIRGTDTANVNTNTNTQDPVRDSQAIYMFIVVALVLVVLAIVAAYFFLHKKESSSTL
ncbi:hypothetical protein HGA91_04675 [candidate division WWE3 bacterium]|nr:hypothetical protein [candidate division WWE3 bacterium]